MRVALTLTLVWVSTPIIITALTFHASRPSRIEQNLITRVPPDIDGTTDEVRPEHAFPQPLESKENPGFKIDWSQFIEDQIKTHQAKKPIPYELFPDQDGNLEALRPVSIKYDKNKKAVTVQFRDKADLINFDYESNHYQPRIEQREILLSQEAGEGQNNVVAFFSKYFGSASASHKMLNKFVASLREDDPGHGMAMDHIIDGFLRELQVKSLVVSQETIMDVASDMKQALLALKVQVKAISQPVKRANPIDIIDSQASSADKSSIDQEAANFLLALEALYSLQANISQAVLPIIDELVTSGNNSLVRQIALSIWSDITASTLYTTGPFTNGLSALTSIEDAYFNSTNTTINANGSIAIKPGDTTTQSMLALHGALEHIYFTYWDKAVKTANSTGQLAELACLIEYLASANSSLYPPGYSKATAAIGVDLGYFGLKTIQGNLTSIPISNR